MFLQSDTGFGRADACMSQAVPSVVALPLADILRRVETRLAWYGLSARVRDVLCRGDEVEVMARAGANAFRFVVMRDGSAVTCTAVSLPASAARAAPVAYDCGKARGPENRLPDPSVELRLKGRLTGAEVRKDPRNCEPVVWSGGHSAGGPENRSPLP